MISGQRCISTCHRTSWLTSYQAVTHEVLLRPLCEEDICFVQKKNTSPFVS